MRRSVIYLMREEEATEGSILIADDGFECMRPSACKVVMRDLDNQELYVECDDGKHYISEQRSEEEPGILVGFLKWA